MELCMEVERLRQIADEQNSEYSDYTQMPFGLHKGKKLGDVPEDYLRWWQSQQDRSIIMLEYQHGPYSQRATATKKARLYDYIKRRLEHGGDEIQGDRENDAAQA
jgi:uncharacterized protein (DUF3820 family)